MNTQAKFDVEKFSRTDFTPRVESVPVPQLKDFFEGDDCEWRVRGLTSDEIAKANEAAVKNQKMDSMIKAISSAAKSEQVEGFRKAMGITDDVSVEVVKRIEHLIVGSVAPVIETQTAVKLAETFPVEFQIITNKILQLTGLGMEYSVEKPKPSGKTEE